MELSKVATALVAFAKVAAITATNHPYKAVPIIITAIDISFPLFELGTMSPYLITK